MEELGDSEVLNLEGLSRAQAQSGCFENVLSLPPAS